MLPIAPVTTSGNAAAKPPSNAIHFSPILAEMARLEKGEVFTRMKTSPEGLSEADAEKRLAEAGPNVIASEKHRGWLWRLLTATRNPLVILLIVLATISFATGDPRAGTVMSLMVILGVSLRFVQEARADAEAAKLKAMITLTTAVVRAGKAEEIPIQQLAPGDVVTLCAGDMIPADVRIISAKDLFVSQATLTGESLPVEKFDSHGQSEVAFRLLSSAGQRAAYAAAEAHQLRAPVFS